MSTEMENEKVGFEGEEMALTVKGKAKKVEVETLAVIEEARGMVIIDDTGFAIAANLLLGIRDLLGEIDSVFNPMISKTHQAHKEACSQMKKAKAPLIEAENIINPKMGAYRQRQEQERRAEIRRQEELARKAMEEAQLRDAIEAAENGDTKEGEAIIDDELMPMPIAKVEKLVTPDDITFRDSWHFEILDAVHIPRAYLMPNEKVIGAIVRQVKDVAKTEKMIPGIRVWCEKKAGRGR